MKNNMSPFINLIILIINIVIVFIANDNLQLVVILMLTLVHSIIYKVNVIKVFKFLYFGIFLSIFTFVINYLYSSNLLTSFDSALRIILIFVIILIHSYIYKVNNSSKEASYAISKLFLFLKPIGYNQNKMYTTMLVVINISFNMSNEVKQMYFHERRMYPKKISIIKKVSIVIELIAPFINKMMFRNEIATLALINKDYKLSNKSIKIYKDYKFSKTEIIYIVLFELILLSSTQFI